MCNYIIAHGHCTAVGVNTFSISYILTCSLVPATLVVTVAHLLASAIPKETKRCQLSRTQRHSSSDLSAVSRLKPRKHKDSKKAAGTSNFNYAGKATPRLYKISTIHLELIADRLVLQTRKKPISTQVPNLWYQAVWELVAYVPPVVAQRWIVISGTGGHSWSAVLAVGEGRGRVGKGGQRVIERQWSNQRFKLRSPF